MDIDPNNPLFQDDEAPKKDIDFGVSDFDILNRVRLVEATAPIYGKCDDMSEWLERLDVLEAWVYGFDGIVFKPESNDN